MRTRSAEHRSPTAPRRVGLAVSLLAAAFASASAAGAGLDEIAEALDASGPAFESAVDAAGLVLALEHAELKLEEGALIPVVMPDGTPATALEWLFVGRARLTSEAPDELEAEQLEHFLGSRRLDTVVRQAVILPGDRWDAASLSAREPVAIAPERRQAVEALFREWAIDTEREGFGARLGLIAALAGDPLARRFAAAWMDAPSVGRLFYAFDPADKEPFTLGAFKQYAMRDFLTKHENRRRVRYERWHARRQAGDVDEPAEPRAECGQRDEQEEEREFPPDFDEVRSWIDLWMSASGEGADPDADPPGFEPERYTVELSLVGEKLDAEGVARIRMRSNTDGLRVVPMSLGRGMDVCSVEDGEGRPLSFHERGSTVLVALEESTVAGHSLELIVRIAGRPIERRYARRTLRHTIDWHPHVGRIDRAVYDVTLRWPSSLALLASGVEVEGGAEDDRRWSRRALDTPAIGFSFEVDEFDVVREQVGHLDLSFGFFKGDERMSAERRAEIITTVKAAFLFYETRLGTLPIDHVSIVVTDRGFAQGLLSFLTLNRSALHYRTMKLYDDRGDEEVRLETIAHEVAHQWWGNLVGWESYRDQWLSEALATFSASRFLTTIAVDPEDHLRREASRRSRALARQTSSGRAVASLGSVMLGGRLSFNFGSEAYQAIVYEKGAAVFGSLAESLGLDATWQMLGALARAVNNRVIRTETFFSAIAHMSGRDLAPFVDSFVRGSGVPVVIYEYAIARDESGQWRVDGIAHRLPSARFRYAVEQTERGWDVVRRFGRVPEISEWVAAVPYVLQTATVELRGGVEIQGARSEFSITSASQPRSFELDPNGRLLAEYHGGRSGSVEVPYRLGKQLLSLGRHAEAEPLLQEALALLEAQDGEIDRHHVPVHLELARLHTDLGDLPAAREQLRQINRMLPANSDSHAGERRLLEARIQLRAGQYRFAAETLLEYLRRYSIELATIDANSLLDASHSTPLLFAHGEMMALLAVAARGSGGSDAGVLAVIADLNGVDVRALGPR